MPSSRPFCVTWPKFRYVKWAGSCRPGTSAMTAGGSGQPGGGFVAV